jgi:hypothetical protein
MSYFHDLEKLGTFGNPDPSLWDSGTEVLETRKPGMSWENRDEWDPYLKPNLVSEETHGDNLILFKI